MPIKQIAKINYDVNTVSTTYDIQALGLSYAVGTGTAAKTSTPYCFSKWEAELSEITELYDGLTIAYKIPVAGNGTYGTCLQVNDLGYHPVVRSTNTMISTRYAVGAVVLLVYDSHLSGSVYGTTAGASAADVASITGVWVCVNDVDNNSNTLLRTYASTTNIELPIAGISTGSTTPSTSNYTSSYKDSYGQIPSTVANRATINLSTGKLTVPGGIEGVASQAIADASGNNIENTYLKLSGGTLTGSLVLSANPTANLEAATKQYVDQSFAANDAMVFKGTIGPSSSTVTALPASHNAGDTYRVNVSATTSYAGQACENGDLIICIKDGTTANNADWTVVQTNLNGAVTGPASSTSGRIATFNGTSGKIIQDSGYTTASFAASTHSHGDISSSGTISTTAVTPGNGDYILLTDSSNSHKVQRGIAIGTTTTSFLANDGTWKTPGDKDTITGWYGTSETAATTSTKSVTCTGYTLNTGNLIGVLFTTSNTAATPALNVNNTGAKDILLGNASANTTTNVFMWSANTIIYFLYDGVYYRYMCATASGGVEPPRGANTWYGTSNTASTTTAKASTVNNFVLTKGATVAINFSTANTVTNAALTLNINSTGAKTIYNNNAATSATNTVTWDANETLTFIYDGTRYHIISRSKSSSGIIMRTWTA